MTELGQGFGVPGFLAIELRTAKHDSADAVNHRGVRIALPFAPSMVLAVDRHPLLGDHAGGQPKPEPVEMHHGGMQVEPAVRLAAMQEDRDARNGDMSHHQGEDDDSKPGSLRQAASGKSQKCVHGQSRILTDHGERPSAILPHHHRTGNR